MQGHHVGGQPPDPRTSRDAQSPNGGKLLSVPQGERNNAPGREPARWGWQGMEAQKVYPDCPFTARSVEVGGLTKAQLVQRLREHSILMNESAERIFSDDRFATSPTKHFLQTVELTVANLGYPQGATLAEIYSRATQLGLELCPLELGPYLRLAYLDQPEGSFGAPIRQHKPPIGAVTIASRPLSEDASAPKGFYVRRIDGALWLRGYSAEMTSVWSAGDHFVFCQPTHSLPK